LLRWLYCLVVHGTGWDPAVAAGRRHHTPQNRAEAA
jgi:hypothetical protein